MQIRHEILESRTHDSKLFHKLINRQRGKVSNCINELHVVCKASNCINELHVASDMFRTKNEILCGWHQHFNQLATPKDSPAFDNTYKKLVELEF